jgi:hypothetical protein
MKIPSKKKSKRKSHNKSIVYSYIVKGIHTDFKIRQINKNTVEATVIPSTTDFPTMKFKVNLSAKSISVKKDGKLLKIASMKKSSQSTSKKSIVIKNDNNVEIVNNINLNGAIDEVSQDRQGRTNRIVVHGIFAILIILSICFGVC